VPAKPAAAAQPARPKGAPSNAIPMQQYTMEQLQKMAASRGLTVNKLVAQMVEQYLKESPEEPGA
jgi:predicted DNA-binding ribbon-helix-helix protein